MTAKSETKKIPFNLNSIAEKILNENYFINTFIESPFDVYLVMHNNVFYEVYKSMNQTFNSPDFNIVVSFHSFEECDSWIEKDIEYSKKVVES